MSCCTPHINGQTTVTPPTAAASKVFQVDDTSTRLSSSTSFGILATIAGDAKVLTNSVWKINMCVLICCPYATSGMGVNAEQKWSIETSAGVFTQFDKYSVDEHITIVGSEKSSPRHRTQKLTASMNAPRMRIEVRRTSAGATSFYWEDPRWGGALITEAP